MAFGNISNVGSHGDETHLFSDDKGYKEGKEATELLVINNMIERGFDVSFIAEIVGLSEDKVKEIVPDYYY